MCMKWRSFLGYVKGGRRNWIINRIIEVIKAYLFKSILMHQIYQFFPYGLKVNGMARYVAKVG